MRLIFFLLTLWCLPGLTQQIAVPELRQQVTDITGTLSTSEQQSLTQQLQDITQKTRAQVAVLIVPSTGDDSIEQYATRVFNNWRLGDAKRNDGILIIVAWSDRTVRIQVGYGLEEKVTDALAGDIIRSNMIPAFKQQKLAKGLELAIIALNNQLTSQHQYSANPSESESSSSSDHYYFAIFWVFAVMFFPFCFFHQGSNFCRACKSSVCISAIYLLDLFLFSDKTFSIAVFFFFFTFTTIMVFTCLCVLQKKASGRSYHSDNSGSGGGGFSGGGGSSGGGGASGRW
ncbi:TPA: YgcG family protein [Escherichia coli]|uniref:TPM domain-containing protein n=1 Tax=Escherichia coli TaxID=562 RepID=UPI0019CE26C9|nr:YgcG family protein [Escherichia coli]EIH4672249.1 YgcG family protein [Escherichia coli]MBT9178700.1 YgcG family protein [Escherichia coli]MCU6838278.1 YgcG family protein [Escherichia coli]MDD8438469.1 YgcG family protein [Escherichia coli]MDD8484009.1 YgcG family protein [Escherichia coli]